MHLTPRTSVLGVPIASLNPGPKQIGECYKKKEGVGEVNIPLQLAISHEFVFLIFILIDLKHSTAGYQQDLI